MRELFEEDLENGILSIFPSQILNQPKLSLKQNKKKHFFWKINSILFLKEMGGFHCPWASYCSKMEAFCEKQQE